MKKLLSILATGVIFGLTVSANATTYSYNANTPGSFGGNFANNNGLGYDAVSASFNSATNQFSWEVDYSGGNPDGFWLVVSDGPNPKYNSLEYTIFYADYNSGNLSAYAYNGENNPNSYQTTQFIGDFSSGLYTEGSDVFGFTLDVSSINSLGLGADWVGTEFGENIGTWFHPTYNLNSSFDENGEITGFTPRQNAYYDTNNDGDCDTGDRGCVTVTEVPEPTTMALMGLGLLGLGASRKKKLFK